MAFLGSPLLINAFFALVLLLKYHAVHFFNVQPDGSAFHLLYRYWCAYQLHGAQCRTVLAFVGIPTENHSNRLRANLFRAVSIYS